MKIKSGDKGISLVAVVVIVVIIVAAIGILLYFSSARLAQAPSGGAAGNAASGVKPVYAPTGQLTSGFPQGMVLGSTTATEESYTIAYGTSTNQYTANFTAKTAIVLLAKLYRTYFAANDWTIENGAFTTSTQVGFYATKGSDIANVVIVAQSATSSNVTATYVESR